MSQWEYKSIKVQLDMSWSNLHQSEIDPILNQASAEGWEPINFAPVGTRNEQLLIVFRRSLQAAFALRDNLWFQATRPLIIGHRGASAHAPENTLKAFKLAQEQGADGIEFDVQLSADSHPVVIHDHTLERTTNGTGNVYDYSAAALAALDAGDGEPIPRLAQLVETCGLNFLYNIEIKEEGERGRQLVRVIAAMIAAYPILA